MENNRRLISHMNAHSVAPVVEFKVSIVSVKFESKDIRVDDQHL